MLIHSNDDEALRRAAERGYLDPGGVLVETIRKDEGVAGAERMIHSNNDEALRSAASDGYLDVVEFLVQNGANIHADDDDAVRYAAFKDRLPVVEFLVEDVLRMEGIEGVIKMIHAINDPTLKPAIEYDYPNVEDYLRDKMNEYAGKRFRF